MKRLLAIALNLCLIAFCDAATFAKQFRVALAAGAPVLTLFVQQGKISEPFKVKLVADLDKGAAHVGQFGDCLEGASNKPGKLQCTRTLEGQMRPLLESNFKTNETVKFIADDIEAILDAVLIYYGGSPSSVGPETMAAPLTEKEIKERIEKLKKDLGQ